MIYTKKGDSGNTSMYNGEKVMKNSNRLTFLGDSDELNSNLGLIKNLVNDEDKIFVHNIQVKLMNINSNISGFKNEPISSLDIEMMESRIDYLMTNFKGQTEFIIYGDDENSAKIHIARAIARRVERSLYSLHNIQTISQGIKQYLNRLSDYLYSLALYTALENKLKDRVLKELNKNFIDTKPINKRKELNLNIVKELINEIEQYALSIGLNAVIAVLDKGANPIAVHCMDNAYIISYDVAMGKAYTAVSLKMNTKQVQKLVQPNQMFYGLESLAGGKIVPIPGGIPLFADDSENGELLGGIGISGGTDLQDDAIAEFASDLWRGGWRRASEN